MLRDFKLVDLADFFCANGFLTPEGWVAVGQDARRAFFGPIVDTPRLNPIPTSLDILPRQVSGIRPGDNERHMRGGEQVELNEACLTVHGRVYAPLMGWPNSSPQHCNDKSPLPSQH